MRYAGPREALFHALVRKNYGIDQPDRRAATTPASAASTARSTRSAIFDRFTAEELGVTPLKLEPTFFCHACDALASPRTCPHDAGSRLELSGTQGARDPARGRPLPAQFTRPEVAEILRAHYYRRRAGPRPARRRARPRAAGGFIVWFTGLSGAGKSTLAEALRRELGRDQRAVEILDGDEVRTLPLEGPRLLARRTATPTSAASATWRACWRATAWP